MTGLLPNGQVKGLRVKCVVPENGHTSPMEGKFQYSFTHFFTFLGLTEPPTPRKFKSLLWGKYIVWIFSGCAQCKNPNDIGKLVDFGVIDMEDATVTVTKGQSSLTNYYCKLYTLHN